MNNEEAYAKAVMLYGTRAVVRYDPLKPTNDHKHHYEIFRKAITFLEWLNTVSPYGLLIGCGNSWEQAFEDAQKNEAHNGTR
jgi:hypothetical protein